MPFFLKNKICPISQSGGKFAEVLKRSLQKEVRVPAFPNFQLSIGDIPKSAFAEAVES